MTDRMLATARCARLLRWPIALVLALVGAVSAETAPLPVCGGCSQPNQPCLLNYGAEGVVQDKVTGEPIAGATVVVLDAEGSSAADGTYHVEGSRVEACHVDYFYSVRATAPGYELFVLEYYASSTFSNLTIELEPDGAPQGFTVSGTVAEFRPCSGRMRGVTVVLEPLGLTMQTSIDAVGGGTFAFEHVPAGDYTVRVAQGCSPIGGCWAVTPVHVEDSDVHVSVCMEVDAPPPTESPCPVSTPCAPGQRPLPCSHQPCGLGCGCERCPPCGAGEVLAPHANRCVCIPGHTDPSPTPTPEPTADSSPIATASTCAGDCNNDGAIGINELVAAVRQALGAGPTPGCAGFDRNSDGAVGVDELIALVRAALDGCA